jgi:hypothetical protein
VRPQQARATRNQNGAICVAARLWCLQHVQVLVMHGVAVIHACMCR